MKRKYNPHNEKDEPSLLTATIVIIAIGSVALAIAEYYFGDWQIYLGNV
jgi:hypothetical protein